MEKSPSWSRAHDWKSCRPLKGLEGSNPSFSAIKTPVTAWLQGFCYVFFLIFSLSAYHAPAPFPPPPGQIRRTRRSYAPWAPGRAPGPAWPPARRRGNLWTSGWMQAGQILLPDWQAISIVNSKIPKARGPVYDKLRWRLPERTRQPADT